MCHSHRHSTGGEDQGGTDKNDSGGFAATAASPFRVQLKWAAVAGAESYLIQVSQGDSDFLQLAELAGDQTSYENFPILPGSELTYRLQVVTSSGINDAGTATATTPEVEPNPLTVQANEYEPITWAPPTPDPQNPNFDPSTMFPPGFDPNNPDSFDPSALMQPVSASAEIGADGGEVTITTPDGITYTLSIPAGALDDVTTISLIPIQSIDGLPFSGGLQGAVRIEPEGLAFDLPAKLTITRADGAQPPDGMLNLTFTFEGPGWEFRLNPFTPDDTYAFIPSAPHLARLSAGPRASGSDGGISVSDAQSYGAAAGTPQEAGAVMENHPPTDSDSNISNIVAYAQQAEEEDLAPLLTNAQMAQATLAQVGEVNWSDLKKTLNKLENLQKI
ncbi:MAG TPA: hypothetical protein VLT51_02875, partial [Anaerolineales bacterium]|nr:hypothetical protein [Anaerolineales bacterium]